MKILLINPIAREWSKPNCFPTGLGYIAGALLEKGHEINIIDLNAVRSIGKEWLDYVLKNHEYDLIGITGIITQYKTVKRIAKECRIFNPGAPIVCGGALATSIPDLILEKTDVNICVLGEGEVAINEIAFIASQTDLSKKKVKYGPKRPIADLSKIPEIPYYRFITEIYASHPIAWYNTRKWSDGVSVEEKKSLNIVGTRGCPHNCIYCYHNYMGQGYRLRKADSIIDEMMYLVKSYNVDYIHFTDDAFCTSKKYMIEFCRKIDGQKFRGDFPTNLKWSCPGRADIVDEELVKKLVDSGCVGLCYGLESGSQTILNRMNKKITIRQYRKAVELNQKYFPYQDYTFIVGCPGETDETINDSINFCKEMGVTPTAVFFMTPYPGTPLFKELLKTSPDFLDLVNSTNLFEGWIENLGEQGERIAWNCTDVSHDKLAEWHQKFIEETGAWNKEKH